MKTFNVIAKILGYAVTGVLAVWAFRLFLNLEWIKTILENWFKK